MLKAIATATAALLIAAVLAGPAAADDVADCRSGEPQRVIAGCTAIIDKGGLEEEALAEAYRNRGIAYLRASDLDRAASDFDQAIEIKPDSAEAHNSRGFIHLSKREFDAAFAEFGKGIALKPDYANPYANRGRTYNVKGDFEKAIVDCTKAIEIDPKLAFAYYCRGEASYKSGKFDAAIVDFSVVIEIEPNLAAAYQNRANAYDDSGQPDKAIADYDEAIRLDPRSAMAYIDRGLANLRQEKFDRAIADYTEAIRLDSSNVRAYLNRGKAYGRKGEAERAIVDLDAAIRLDPDNAEAHFMRGLAQQNLGLLDAALEEFDAAIAFNPDFALPHLWRGVVHLGQRKYEQAVTDLRKALEIDPALSQARDLLAKLETYEGPAPAPPLDQVLGVPAQVLAHGYLAVEATATLVEAFAGSPGNWTIKTTLDGRDSVITADNREVYLKVYRERLQTYGQAIKKRGSPSIAGQYSVAAADACRGERLDPREFLSGSRNNDGAPVLFEEMTIRQAGFDVRLVVPGGEADADSGLPGIVVEDAVVFVNSTDFSFWGTVKEKTVELRLDVDELKGQFGPNAATDTDWQAIPDCVFTLTRK
ncbi:MAG: tetratricopeptide repeat protein [Bauldia sp.]